MSRFKYWLREYIGINDLARNQQSMYPDLATLHTRTKNIGIQVGAVLSAIARVVAKLDPHHSRNELDPAMKAESDIITEREIARLKAEQAVRDQYGYTPKSE